MFIKMIENPCTIFRDGKEIPTTCTYVPSSVLIKTLGDLGRDDRENVEILLTDLDREGFLEDGTYWQFPAERLKSGFELDDDYITDIKTFYEQMVDWIDENEGYLMGGGLEIARDYVISPSKLKTIL